MGGFFPTRVSFAMSMLSISFDNDDHTWRSLNQVTELSSGAERTAHGWLQIQSEVKRPSRTGDWSCIYYANRKPTSMKGRHDIPHIFPSHSSWQSMFLRSAASSISLLPFANVAAEQGRGVLINDRTLDVAKPSVHLWAALGSKVGCRRNIAVDLVEIIPKPVESSHGDWEAPVARLRVGTVVRLEEFDQDLRQQTITSANDCQKSVYTI